MYVILFLRPYTQLHNSVATAQCPSLCSALQPIVSEAPSALHCEQGWTAVESRMSYTPGHKARWLLALLRKAYTLVHEVGLDAVHKFSSGVCLTLRAPG